MPEAVPVMCPATSGDFVRRRLDVGWSAFIERVTGRPYPGSKKRRDWTKEKLLSEIRRLKATGNRLTYRAVAAVNHREFTTR